CRARMDTKSQHLLIELHGCDPRILDAPPEVDALLRAAAVAAGATVVGSSFHRFNPQGVSVVVVLEESHFSVHTWPETGYAAADFFTCGACEPERAVSLLREGLRAREVELLRVDRGLPGPRSIEAQYHRRS